MTPLFLTTLANDRPCAKRQARSSQPRLTAMAGAVLSAMLLLSGCNQQPTAEPESSSEQTPEQIRAAAESAVPMSGSAKARIAQFEPVYVAQMQSLQRRLQAEFESLQAADAPNSNPSLLTTPDAPNTNALNNDAPNTEAAVDADSAASQNAQTAVTTDDTTRASTATENDNDLNTSTEVGVRDLEVLKRISLEPQAPEILNEDEIRERYQSAMESLYEPAVTPLSAQNIDTLLTIATLIPQIFEHEEIAKQLSVKSPALARLIAQHQVWEQIEAQQAASMQQMKIDQQAEFETLMSQFNETIKGYDEQIAKYEQTLESFE